MVGQHGVVPADGDAHPHRSLVLRNPYGDLGAIRGGEAADGHAAHENVGQCVIVPWR